MQLTNLQVLNVSQALNVLSQNKLPIKLSWRVATAIRSLDPFMKAADETMKEVRMKYAVKDDQGKYLEAIDKEGNPIPNTVQIPNDKVVILNTEMDELLNQTVTVENVTLHLSDFPDKLELEPSVLNALIPIIDDKPVELNLVK